MRNICTVWGPSCCSCIFFDKRLQPWLNFRETSRETFQPAHDQCISMSQRNHQVRPDCKKFKPNGVWLFRCSPLDSAGCTLNSTTVTEIGDMLHTFVRERHANSAMHLTAINMSTWPTWYICPYIFHLKYQAYIESYNCTYNYVII